MHAIYDLFCINPMVALLLMNIQHVGTSVPRSRSWEEEAIKNFPVGRFEREDVAGLDLTYMYTHAISLAMYLEAFCQVVAVPRLWCVLGWTQNGRQALQMASM
jgi:hypothetical protein